MKKNILITILLLTLFSCSQDSLDSSNLKEAIDNPLRKQSNIARDKFRNPLKTLQFFGISKDLKILEIVPGSGWYTEIIGYFMKNTENYYVAVYEKPKVKILQKIQNDFFEYFDKNKKIYGNIRSIGINENLELNSQDLKFDIVLTFRNTHNWLKSNKAEHMYKSIYNSMNKGGILGVVQHRADESMKLNYKKGYVKESFLINLVEEQGFIFIGKTEINSNPRDLKNYDKGVWTLPPRLVDGDEKKYLKIGESDRMTLKFIKK